MILSAMMAICINSTMVCTVIPFSDTSMESRATCDMVMRDVARSELAKTGKDGWSEGGCFEPGKYTENLNRGVAFLEKSGYTVSILD